MSSGVKRALFHSPTSPQKGRVPSSTLLQSATKVSAFSSPSSRKPPIPHFSSPSKSPSVPRSTPRAPVTTTPVKQLATELASLQQENLALSTKLQSTTELYHRAIQRSTLTTLELVQTHEKLAEVEDGHHKRDLTAIRSSFDSALQRQEETITRLETQLTSTRQELQSAKTELDKRTQTFTEHSAESEKARKKALEQAEKQQTMLVQLSHDFQTKSQVVTSLQRQLEQVTSTHKEALSTSLHQRSLEQTIDQSELESQLTKAKEDAQSAKTELDAHKLAFAKLQEESLKDREKSLETSGRQQAIIDRLTTDHTAKSEKATSLQRQLDEATTTHKEQLASLETQLATAKKESTSQEARIASLEAQLATKSSEGSLSATDVAISLFVAVAFTTLSLLTHYNYLELPYFYGATIGLGCSGVLYALYKTLPRDRTIYY